MKYIILAAGENAVEKHSYDELRAIRSYLNSLPDEPPAVSDEDWLAVPPTDRAVFTKMAIVAKCRFHEAEQEIKLARLLKTVEN